MRALSLSLARVEAALFFEPEKSSHLDLHLEQTKIRAIRVEVHEVDHKIHEVYEAEVGVVVEVRNPNSVPG